MARHPRQARLPRSGVLWRRAGKGGTPRVSRPTQNQGDELTTKTTITLTDGELRQAIEQWVKRHGYKLLRYTNGTTLVHEKAAHLLTVEVETPAPGLPD